MVAGFEWDPAKRFANLAKHGVDFVDASGIFWRPVLETTDERHALWRGEDHRCGPGCGRDPHRGLHVARNDPAHHLRAKEQSP